MKIPKAAMVTIAIGVLVVISVAVRGGLNFMGQSKVTSTDQANAASLPATPADGRIRAAEVMIKRAGNKPDGHNLLACSLHAKGERDR